MTSNFIPVVPKLHYKLLKLVIFLYSELDANMALLAATLGRQHECDITFNKSIVAVNFSDITYDAGVAFV